MKLFAMAEDLEHHDKQGRCTGALIGEGALKMDTREQFRFEEEQPASDGAIIAEIQLILAEKRTSLAVLRTGIAMLVLPLSVLGLLVATSRYYEIAEVLHILVPLFAISLALVALSGYLIVRSVRKLRREDHLIMNIKRKHSRIAEFID